MAALSPAPGTPAAFAAIAKHDNINLAADPAVLKMLAKQQEKPETIYFSDYVIKVSTLSSDSFTRLMAFLFSFFACVFPVTVRLKRWEMQTAAQLRQMHNSPAVKER